MRIDLCTHWKTLNTKLVCITLLLIKKQNFCDNSNLYDGCVTKFGGHYSNGDNAGVCYLNVNNTASNSNANIGGHVIFLYFFVS